MLVKNSIRFFYVQSGHVGSFPGTCVFFYKQLAIYTAKLSYHSMWCIAQCNRVHFVTWYFYEIKLSWAKRTCKIILQEKLELCPFCCLSRLRLCYYYNLLIYANLLSLSTAGQLTDSDPWYWFTLELLLARSWSRNWMPLFSMCIVIYELLLRDLVVNLH